MIPTTLDLNSFSGDIWFTADYHFGHENNIGYSKRPWKKIGTHDHCLIDNAHAYVGKNDLFVINGDLTMQGPQQRNQVQKWISKLPGIKILVYGNHDKFMPLQYIDMGFSMAVTSLVLPGGIFVAHDPAWAQVWDVNKPVICAHVHQLFKSIDNVVNCGVDVWDYFPVHLEELLAECSESRGERDWQKASDGRHHG